MIQFCLLSSEHLFLSPESLSAPVHYVPIRGKSLKIPPIWGLCMYWDVEEVVKIQEYSQAGPPEHPRPLSPLGSYYLLVIFEVTCALLTCPPSSNGMKHIGSLRQGSPLNQGTFAEDCRSGQSPAKNREKREKSPGHKATYFGQSQLACLFLNLLF